MRTLDDRPIRVPWLLLLHPAFLTLWSTALSVWFLVDGAGAFEAFGIPTQAEPFVLITAAGRYLGIAVGLWLALLVFRTRRALLVALLARLTMDLVDTYAGVQTGLLPMTFVGFLQPFLMFIGPNLLTLGWLVAAPPKRSVNQEAPSTGMR